MWVVGGLLGGGAVYMCAFWLVSLVSGGVGANGIVCVSLTLRYC